MDYRLEQWINAGAGQHPVLDNIMIGLTKTGEPIFIGVVILWFLVGWVRQRPIDRRGAITALIGAGLALLVNQVIIHLIWARPRPFVAHPDTVHVLVKHATDPGFPSDHASPAFAIALVLLSVHRRIGLLAVLFAIVMTYARVYVGDHYPGDIAAGAVVGLAVTLVLTTWLAPVMAWLSARIDTVLNVVPFMPRAVRSER